MAYRKRYGSYKAKKRTKRSGRRYRSTVKTRLYRKYKARITKKRVLNMTSRKKRDTMLTRRNTDDAGAASALNTGAVRVLGGGTSNEIPCGYFLYCPSARQLSTAGNNSFPISAEAGRTATTIYGRGYKERIRITSSSGQPWLWRRIVFMLKFALVSSGADTSPNQPPVLYAQTAGLGMTRVAQNIFINNTPKYAQAINDLVFKGAAGIDWIDVMDAPIDTRRIDLVSDRTTRMVSGNNLGFNKEYTRWHSINKNIVYDDDELGDVMTGSFYSVRDKRGAGNMYVMDLFSPGQAGGASSNTDYLVIDFNGTFYWHEK